MTHPSLLTNEVMQVASALHERLVSAGRMHSFFDPMFSSEPDEEGRACVFDPGKIVMINVHHNGDDSLRVPVFARFLRLRSEPKECVICTDELVSVDAGSAREWLADCEGFRGNWMWIILMLPLKARLEMWS